MNFGAIFSSKWMEKLLSSLNKEEFRAHTFGGFSSNNLAVPYMTTVTLNEASKLFSVLSNDSSDGLRLQAVKDCEVSGILRGINNAAGVVHMGFSLNTASLDTNIQGINPREILTIETINSLNYFAAVLPPRKISANDIVNLHFDTGLTVANNASWEVQFYFKD